MSELKLKATGVQREGSDVKDYKIVADGHEFLAVNNGKGKFTCEQARVTKNSTLKEVKMAIAVAVENGDVSQEGSPSQPVAQGTWDCIHPCALLVDMARQVFGKMSPDGSVVFDPQIKRTLDNFGYLTPEGKVDMAAVGREMAKAL